MLSTRPLRSREALVFRAALAIAAVHALDDAFIGRQPGVGLGQNLAGMISIAVAAAAVFAFGRVRPGVRAGLAIGLGVPALVNGAMHVTHIKFDAAAASDITGVLAVGAGLVLIGLGATIPWLHRGEAAASAARRWGNRALAVPFAALFALLAVIPVGLAIFETPTSRARSSAARRTVPTSTSPSMPTTACASRAGIAPPATAPRSSSCTAAAVTAAVPSTRRACSSATATASCCRMPAAAVRARAVRTPMAGTGSATPPARWTSSPRGATSAAGGSAPSGCPAEPTRSSTSRPRATTCAPSSPTARRCGPSRTAGASVAWMNRRHRPGS